MGSIPASRSAISVDRLAASDLDKRSAHIARRVGHQEQHHIGNIFRLGDPAERHGLVEFGNGRIRIEPARFETGPKHRGVHLQRADRVYPYFLMGMVAGQALGQRGDGGL